MPNDSAQDLICALEEVLDLERSALVEGGLDRLSSLTPKKENLIGKINSLQVFGNEELLRVQKKVERNQSLLNSAADGIRAAMNRLAEMRKIRQEFTTYDATGQRTGFAMRDKSKLEKRA
ncbi:MAG: flagellar biosynthesis protein FlgN [Ruegeria sp.]